MFKKLLASWCCCLCVSAVSAQALKPTLYYMGLPDVSKAAKDYHVGLVPAGDDEETYSIADSMRTWDVNARPFYIFLVSKILMTANRKVSLNMGRSCRSFFQDNPDAVIGLLFSSSVKPAYKYQWARVIAMDMSASCAGMLQQCFKTSRVAALKRCSEGNKEHLEMMYNEVRSALHIHH